jgi:hypothetical protein
MAAWRTAMNDWIDIVLLVAAIWVVGLIAGIVVGLGLRK